MIKKKLTGEARFKDAKRWLHRHPPKDLIAGYSKRYGVSPIVAVDDLMGMGCYDEIYIQQYEKDGIEWEYRMEPLSGEMVVVPKGAVEHVIYESHDLP